MSTKLFFQAMIKFLFGVLIVGLLIFVSAGAFNYFNGWLFMGLLFIPMFFAGIILMLKNPSLLKRRLDAKEKEEEQKSVIVYSGIMFLLGFIGAGLDYRFNLTRVPNIVVIIASVLFVIAYLLYAEVLRENEFLSRTIGVEKNQNLVDTGAYAIVRHPMYSVTIVLFLTMPLILDSWISFLIFLLYPFIIAKRIENEEEVLSRKLKGYTAYKRKVKCKLIPFVY